MFIGNQKIVQFLSKVAGSNKIAQAYLFSGPERVGKFTLAKIFAKSLIQRKPSKLENDNKNIPDLIIIEPEVEEKKGVIKEKDIKIEKIREIQKDLALFPYSGKFKVLIINNAHRMTVSAQNALLKILEEPNETSVIILITHEESKILPTIKSRCQKLSFSLASAEEIVNIVSDSKEAKKLAVFSMGRPGLALEIKENKDIFDLRNEHLNCLNRFHSMGINERFNLSEKLSSNISELINFLEFWVWIIRIEALKRGERKFFNFQTIEKIGKSLEIIKNTNANVRLVIENLFLEI
ncbi:MAG: AAA family ATPase [Patescibacteria group bacterium]